MISPRLIFGCAQVAELADALDSGSSVRKDVGVRIPPWADSLLEKADLSAFFVHFQSDGRSFVGYAWEPLGSLKEPVFQGHW